MIVTGVGYFSDVYVELCDWCLCCVGVFDNPTCSGWETHLLHFSFG